jgi:hypothetical protein
MKPQGCWLAAVSLSLHCVSLTAQRLCALKRLRAVRLQPSPCPARLLTHPQRQLAGAGAQPYSDHRLQPPTARGPPPGAGLGGPGAWPWPAAPARVNPHLCGMPCGCCIPRDASSPPSMPPKKRQRGQQQALTEAQRAERVCSICEVAVPGAFTWLDPDTQQPRRTAAAPQWRATSSGADLLPAAWLMPPSARST